MSRYGTPSARIERKVRGIRVGSVIQRQTGVGCAHRVHSVPWIEGHVIEQRRARLGSRCGQGRQRAASARHPTRRSVGSSPPSPGAGDALIAARTAMPIVPPVRATEASSNSSIRSPTIWSELAATAAARASLSGCRMTRRSLLTMLHDRVSSRGRRIQLADALHDDVAEEVIGIKSTQPARQSRRLRR